MTELHESMSNELIRDKGQAFRKRFQLWLGAMIPLQKPWVYHSHQDIY